MHNGGFELTAGGTCAAVVGMKDCMSVTGFIKPTVSNNGGWEWTARRTWCNGNFREAMPTAFKSLFKQFKVTSDAGAFSEEIVVTDDYFTFPAEKEVFGTNTFANATVESSLFQFDIFKTVANRIKQVKDNASAWWERSAGANYAADFGIVQSDGTSAGDVANDNQGISPVGVI